MHGCNVYKMLKLLKHSFRCVPPNLQLGNGYKMLKFKTYLVLEGRDWDCHRGTLESHAFAAIYTVINLPNEAILAIIGHFIW